MPHSIRDNDHVVRDYVARKNIRTVLDIGAGSGTYARLLGGDVGRIDAVEAWEPYIDEYKLHDLYDTITVADVRTLARSIGYLAGTYYDLIIFGDIIEHMSTADGMHVWDWAKTVASHGLLSVPTVHWPQDHVGGNPYEAHVQDLLTVEDYEKTFGPFDEVYTYDQTATFLVQW